MDDKNTVNLENKSNLEGLTVIDLYNNALTTFEALELMYPDDYPEERGAIDLYYQQLCNAIRLDTLREVLQVLGLDDDEPADDPQQQQQKVCCICGEPLDGIGGMGNNPWPIDTRPGEECCSLCNSALVIPARLTLRKMQRDYLNGTDPKETLESLNLDDDTDDDGDGSDKANASK